MSWPFRALFGPMLWAIAFAAIYALHGIGCARGWTGVAMPGGNLHQLGLTALWLIALFLHVVLFRVLPPGILPPEDARAKRLIHLADLIGLSATLLTLFPVLGLTTCQPPF